MSNSSSENNILTLFLLALFIQIINLIEVSQIVESSNMNMFTILYLSLLKLPSTINQIIPFVIIISTAFFYRYLISVQINHRYQDI